MYGYKYDGSDHDDTVLKVMELANKVGMQFNPNKCQFKQESVKFFGLILTREGIVPDPAKIEASEKIA